jgi:hypothetical protein
MVVPLFVAVVFVLVGSLACSNEPEPVSVSGSAPVKLPAIGEVFVLGSMAEAILSAGELIEVLRRDPDTGAQILRLVIDPASRMGFREMTTTPNPPYPGFGLMIFDDGGHCSMSELGLEVYPYGGADFAHIVSLYDHLSGESAEVVGHGTVDGRPTFLVRMTRTIGEGDVVFATADVTAYVDPVTGLVVREQWDVAGEIMKTERRVIDATPELMQRMDIQNMQTIVEGYRQTRKSGLEEAPFPVFGLPPGYQGLELSSIFPAPDWGMVQLQYGEPGLAEYVLVTTINPQRHPDYGGEYLAPLSQAWEIGAGDRVVELRFGIDGVGVQVQARQDIYQVAQDLIVVGGPGSQ